MKAKLVIAARIVLGLPFAVLGVISLFQLVEMPPPEGEAGEFVGALVESGYFFQFLKIVEIVCGVLLILGLHVPLALLVLAPVVVNIVLFHAFLGPSGLPLALVLLALGIFLAYSYRNSFKSVLLRRAPIG